MDLIEVNFDGLVGPTHHYGGLGRGNLASQQHAGRFSNPRLAALQGLDKMAQVVALADGAQMRQAILPPQIRPDLNWLRGFGFYGSDAEVLEQATRTSPALLSSAWSASAMWTANAATCSPSCDTEDQRLHLTIANLASTPHRSLEARQTEHLFKQIFHSSDRFCVHPPLAGGLDYRDEGAANHLRLGSAASEPGIPIFVHGSDSILTQQKYLARQSEAASRAIARRHRLSSQRTLFWRQHPTAIDAGAFHNDVVATSYGNVFLYHEQAFLDDSAIISQLTPLWESRTDEPLLAIKVLSEEISLADAVASYLFNCQLIPRPRGGLAMLCPVQCREIRAAWDYLDRLLDSQSAIQECHFLDLRESMWNGGGPACLRLRVPMTEPEYQALPKTLLWSAELDRCLRETITSGYRDRVSLDDLRSPEFAEEARLVTEKIHHLLGLRALTAEEPSHHS